MTANKIYPGMLGENSVEFFNHHGQIKAIQSGTIYNFTDLPLETIKKLKKAINADKVLKMELKKWHPFSELKQIEQFVKCRFGGLDFTADIKDGELQDGEYWDCPFRGKCASEGVLCKLPMHDNKRLTNTDVKLFQLTASDDTNEVIAEKLEMPLGSFHKYKEAWYKRLGVRTKQEFVLVGRLFNLI